jgi:hypothetical protein
MLRDASQNVAINRLNQSNTSTAAAAGITTLTAASSYSQTLTGTGNQTFKMPDATTLTTGVAFIFNNNATGTLTLQDSASGAIGTITAGGAVELVCVSTATVAGTWDYHGFLPENVTWGTNALALGSTVITGGTWNGGTIPTGYGGTGLTTFTAANNALYSTSSSALAAGTLPVAAGGTGLTAGTSGGIPYYSSTSALTSSALLTQYGVVYGGGAGAAPVSTAAGTTGQVLTATTGGAPTWAAAAGATITGTTTSATYYVIGTTSTSGSLTTASISNTNVVSYNASTGALSAVSHVSSSDESLKTNWRGVAPDFIEQLAGVKSGVFDRVESGNTEAGVSAQSLQKVLAEAVVAGEDGMLSVNYGGAALVAAIKLAERVVALEARLAALEK